MVPRTGPFSAISARAMTSWYQRGKSSARVTIAPLLMGAQVTGANDGPSTNAPSEAVARSGRRVSPRSASVRGGAAVDRLDLRRGVIGVHARRLEELAAVGL